MFNSEDGVFSVITVCSISPNPVLCVRHNFGFALEMYTNTNKPYIDLLMEKRIYD